MTQHTMLLVRKRKEGTCAKARKEYSSRSWKVFSPSSSGDRAALPTPCFSPAMLVPDFRSQNYKTMNTRCFEPPRLNCRDTEALTLFLLVLDCIS